MTVGALVGAYQEDDSGGLRALLPLAGRTLLEYQVRCAAAAGAAPVVVMVERIPAALNEALERLRQEGLPVVPVTDAGEAASRFEAGALVLLVADGIAPPPELIARIAEVPEPAVAILPDTEPNSAFERIDAESRWAGVALVSGSMVASTAAMLGDWDLQSTLLRRTLQEGALRVPLASDEATPLLATSPEQLASFERNLVVASRGARRDWASRYVLPIFEEFATEQLMESRIRPQWLVWAALGLTGMAVAMFMQGWLWAGLALLVLSTPLDLIARRLAVLRLSPLPPRMLARRLLWPATGVALLALGWWLARNGGGWGAFATAAAAAAFAEAGRVERAGSELPGQLWLFSRRNAILGALPFAAAGAWTAAIVALAIYAAASFFLVQHWHHRIRPH